MSGSSGSSGSEDMDHIEGNAFNGLGCAGRKEKKSKSHDKEGKESSSNSKNSHQQPAIHLPVLFMLIEQADWKKVAERAKLYPQEVSTWAIVRKSSGGGTPTSSSSFSADSPRLVESSASFGSPNSQDGGNGPTTPVASAHGRKVSAVKCKALHHACHRLRSLRHRQCASEPHALNSDEESVLHRSVDTKNTDTDDEDEYVEACKAILTLLEIHPEAASQRESRHGCLPLHLAAFGMCSSTPLETPLAAAGRDKGDEPSTPIKPSGSPPLSRPPLPSPATMNGNGRPGSGLPPLNARDERPLPPPPLPGIRTGRSSSHSSTEISLGGISAMIKRELTSPQLTSGGTVMGAGNRSASDAYDSRGALSPSTSSINDSNSPHDEKKLIESFAEGLPSKPSMASDGSEDLATAGSAFAEHSPNRTPATPPKQMNIAEREEYSLRVISALLDAYSKGARVDSEGGRLPLHLACAGRASAIVIWTLLRAYPDAARHRNKEGYLPLHLAAHWGVSHPEIAPALLRAYPDATIGRNRWEQTPLEEALAMGGENGRPHQEALVRALRRHPSYWTRRLRTDGSPPSVPRPSCDGGSDCNKPPKKDPPKNLVDVDETIPDDESSDQDDEKGKGLLPQTENDEADAAPLPRHGDGCGVEETQGGFMARISPLNIIRKTHLTVDTKKKKKHTRRRHASPSRDSGNRSSLASVGSAGQSTTNLRSSPQADLPTMIKLGSWNSILARCKSHPADFADFFPSTVRGGYPARLSALHLAVERSPPLNVVEALVEVCSDALSRRKNPGGQLPLHAACTWGASPEIISCLLSANSSAAQSPDDLSNLPLHCACYSGASEEIIEALLGAYPRSVLIRNTHGSSPSDVVRRLRHPNRRAVLDLLELKAKELQGKKGEGSDGESNSSPLSSAISLDDGTDEGMRENGGELDEKNSLEPSQEEERVGANVNGDDLDEEKKGDDNDEEDDDDDESKDSDGMLWI